MANENKTVAEIVREMRKGMNCKKCEFDKYNTCEGLLGCNTVDLILGRFADRIEAAHRRDREAARRRAERSAIYNMLESFPYDWECNPEAVKKWLAMWQRNADELCEGGMYAE